MVLNGSTSVEESSEWRVVQRHCGSPEKVSQRASSCIGQAGLSSSWRKKTATVDWGWLDKSKGRDGGREASREVETPTEEVNAGSC